VGQAKGVLWLAQRTFLRGSFSNLSTIFLIAVHSLVFFAWYLHKILPNPLFQSEKLTALMTAEFILISCLVINFLSLFILFWLIHKARYHEIGLLRGIGGRRAFIFKLLLIETQFAVLCSLPLALLLGFVLQSAAGELIQPLFGSIDGEGGIFKVLLAALAALGSALLAATLAVLYPALALCRIEPHNALQKRD
jgi:ABC-type lipoprotein release transport system permease subunit